MKLPKDYKTWSKEKQVEFLKSASKVNAQESVRTHSQSLSENV